MLTEKANFTITGMARLLEISRSGYCFWLGQKPSHRAIRRRGSEQKVAWFSGESKEVYGQHRLRADLRADGETISVSLSPRPCNASV